MLHTVKKVNGRILWANLHLLFWLSLIPFATAWIGEHHFAPYPMMFYGIILFMNGFAYFLLQIQIIKIHGKDSLLSQAIGYGLKEKASVFLYLAAIILAYNFTVVSGAIYIFVAMMWLVPDKRIERVFNEKEKS